MSDEVKVACAGIAGLYVMLIVVFVGSTIGMWTVWTVFILPAVLLGVAIMAIGLGIIVALLIASVLGVNS